MKTARNPELESLVLEGLFDCMKERIPTLSMITDKEMGKSMIKAKSRVREKGDYRIRIFVLNFIGYGYDFMSRKTAEKSYRDDVEDVKKGTGRETFLDQGTQKYMGWYVTHT